MDQKPAILLRPFARDIIIAKDRKYPPQARLKLGEDRRVPDIAAMQGKVAALDHFPDPRVERPMGIGEQGNAYLFETQ